jgi:hypothetical protein
VVGAAYNANGGLYEYQQAMTRAFADGGFASGIYAGRPGSIHKFAEPETIWEAYISGKPDQRDRNIGIAYDALNRLGAAPQQTQAAPVYVQNPWTGEYLLAKTAAVAGRVVSAAARADDVAWSSGEASL